MEVDLVFGSLFVIQRLILDMVIFLAQRLILHYSLF